MVIHEISPGLMQAQHKQAERQSKRQAHMGQQGCDGHEGQVMRWRFDSSLPRHSRGTAAPVKQ
jgi:hypothetical protein